MQFDDIKTQTRNLRVSPIFKATLKALAEAEHRSMVNMLVILVLERTKTAASVPAHARVHRGQPKQAARRLSRTA
jgi:hypothetical protein